MDISELNVLFTFSKWCRSGLVGSTFLTRCECSRCRKARNEPVTEETEYLAATQAKQADLEWENNMRKFLN